MIQKYITCDVRARTSPTPPNIQPRNASTRGSAISVTLACALYPEALFAGQ